VIGTLARCVQSPIGMTIDHRPTTTAFPLDTYRDSVLRLIDGTSWIDGVSEVQIKVLARILFRYAASVLTTGTVQHHSADCTMRFGSPRPETGCPRCIELANGAPARPGWSRRSPQHDDRAAIAAIRAHYASDRHRSGGCGPVCTFGEW
jgi:hypothetical protein